MTCCALCRGVPAEKFKRDILLDKVGEPPELIVEILLRITIDIEHSFNSTEVCDKCTNKIARYYEAIQVAEQIKQDILQLIQQDHVLETIYVDEEECIESTEIIEAIVKEEEFIQECPPDSSELLIVPKTSKYKHRSMAVELENDTDEVNIKTENTSTTEKESNAIVENTTFDCSGSKGISMYHSSGIGQPMGIRCEVCDRVFKYARTFHAHKKYKSFVGYICEICGIQCLTKAGIKDHAKVHKPEKEFQCEICDAQFHRKFLLKQHMAYHSNEKSFQCEICAKCFVHRVALNVHKKIHTDHIRRIECQICDKKFRSVTHLRRHMAIHTGAKPFSCPICHNRFSQAYNMKAHMKLHTQAKGDVKKGTIKLKDS